MSITEIAKEAGVSVSSISRFFNAPEKVAPGMAARIRKVVAAKKFSLSVVRPGPKTPESVGLHTGVIVFLTLGDMQAEAMMQMQAMPQLMTSIQSALLARHLTLMLAHMGADGSLPAELTSKSCDGVLLYGRPEREEDAERILRLAKEIPTVWCFREHADPTHEVDHVLYDNRLVGKLAANYLRNRGHESVAVFNAEIEHRAYAERVKVFQDRCHDLKIESCALVPADAIHNAGVPQYRRLAEQFLATQRGITGAFFVADSLMLGVLNELRAMDFDISKLDCIGVNNNRPLLHYLSPCPATIDIRMAEIGRLAVEDLLQRINRQGADYCTEIFIKPELVKGEENLFGK